MKRKLTKIVFLVLMITLFCVIFAFGSSATYGDTPLLPLNGMTWQVCHEDGSIEFLKNFTDPFEVAQDGDVFTLLPDYIEVDLSYSYTAPSNADYTLNFRSATVVFTDNTVKTPYLCFTSGSVTVLSDGAEVYLPLQVSALFSFSGSAHLSIYGGDGKFSVWAPDAIEFSGNATGELHDVHFFKQSGNMMGLLCARGSSSIKVYDSLIYSEKNMNALYLYDKGKVELYDSAVISKDNTKVMQFNGEGVSLKTFGRCYIYGAIDNLKNTIFSENTYVNVDPSAFLAEGCHAIDVNAAVSFPTTSFAEPDVSTSTPTYATFRYVVKSVGSVMEPDGVPVVWEIRDGEGEQIGFSGDFFAPFSALAENEDYSFTLLRDISVDYLPKIQLSGNDITLNLRDHKLAVAAPEGHTDSITVFSFAGSGSVSLLADGATLDGSALSTLVSTEGNISVDLELLSSELRTGCLVLMSGEGSVSVTAVGTNVSSFAGTSLIFAGGAISAELELNDSFLVVDTLANTLNGNISVSGGSCVGLSGAILLSDNGNISVTDAYLFTDSGSPVVRCAADALIIGSTLISHGGFAVDVGGSAVFEGCDIVYGTLAANNLDISEGTLIGDISGFGNGLLCSPTVERIAVTDYSWEDGELVARTYGITCEYRVVSLDGRILSNYTFDRNLILHIYVPAFATIGREDFSVRIVVDGLVYSADADEAESVQIGGEDYLKYSYPYIYQNVLYEEAKVEVVCDSRVIRLDFTPFDLLVAGIEEAAQNDVESDDEALDVGVYYLNYALYGYYDDAAHGELCEAYPELREVRYGVNKNDELSDVFRSAVINYDEDRIDLYLKNKGSVSLDYSYNGRTVRAEAEEQVISIRMHRLDVDADMVVYYGSGSFASTLRFNLVDLFSLVSDSPSRNSELFSKYIAYLTRI